MSPGQVLRQLPEHLPLALQQQEHQVSHSSPVSCLEPCPRFQYTHTDGRGWPTYQYLNSQHQVIYLHFYDEGLFYDGFYVINDLEVRLEILARRQALNDLSDRQDTRRWTAGSSSTTLTVTTAQTTPGGTGKDIDQERNVLLMTSLRYYWTGTKWIWDESIYLADCNASN